MPKPHLYIHTPVPIFKARVNMAVVTYPISVLTYDGVTLGAFGDVAFDATLLLGTAEGLDDLGRVRVKSVPDSDSIPVARSSRGVEDGTLDVQDNAYITILDDYRVWAKIPYFDLGDEDEDEDDIDFKDGDVPVGTFNVDIPPVANTGPGFADYINDDDIITVEFPKGGVDLSYAMADGATLVTYAWDVADGTITVGTAASEVITVTFPAGFRYVALTVVDSNDVSHTSRCPVLAVDPDDDVTVKSYQLTQRLTITGQTLDIELFEDALRTIYPDGTLVMFWWDEADAPDSREHMKFIGWLDTENWGTRRQKKGFTRSTTLHCIDGLGRLQKLPGFALALEREFNEAQWSLMPSLDMSKAVFYLAFWHSTLINIVDFFLPAGGETYDSFRIDVNGASLFDQMNGLANKIVPDHYLCCNSQGQVSFLVNWLLQDIADRPEADPVLTESDFSDLQSDYDRHPKVHVLRSGAIKVHTVLEDIGGVMSSPLVFSIAPGDAQAFGQGASEQIEPEGLALDQDALNECEGHRYAMLNSRHGPYKFGDPRGTLFWSYEPALVKRVQLEFAAIYAAQRGLDWTEEAGQVQDITISYNASKKGLSIKVGVTWKKETSGFPALTYIPDESEDVDFEPVPPPEPFVPPDPTDPDLLFGDITGYVMWADTEIARTWDLQESSPTWVDISGTISGDVFDVQYMMVDEETVGAWCMTATGIYFTDNIMAVSPTWEEVLTITDVRATAVAPASGTVDFASMTHYWLQPGHLCVAMTLSEEDDNYLHCYYWVTEDYGETWTPVDVTAFTFSSDAATRCYYQCWRYGLASFRSSPTLWCARGNGRTSSSNGDGAVFKSIDGGLTWTKEDVVVTQRVTGMALLNPYPDDTDPSYLVVTSGGASPVATFWVSTDGWATSTQIPEPAGHAGGFGFSLQLQRPNKNPFDDLHILNIFVIDSSSNGDLYESNDGGSTWDLLENLNNSTVTPNGWPPDPDQWVLIDNTADPAVRLTLDNFGTLLDRSGNLSSVVTLSAGQIYGGFALPKVGFNRGDSPFPAMGSISTGGGYIYQGETLVGAGLATSNADGSISNAILIHPPANIVRVRVEGTYECTYTKGGFSTGFAIFEISDSTSDVATTSSLVGHSDSAPENDVASGSFWAEFELLDDWPVDKDEALTDPPTAVQVPYIRARVFSSSESVNVTVVFSFQVVEMEDDEANIYVY